jgi:hypothetical protein
MPKFATINPIYKNNASTGYNNLTQNNCAMTNGAQPAMLMELPAGSMIVNGQYVDAKTLTPKFGRLPAPVVVGTSSTATWTPPYAIITANFRQMTQLANGLNTWLISSYGKLNNNIYDGQYNKLHVYNAFPGSSNNGTGSIPGSWYNKSWGPIVQPVASQPPFSYSVWDGTTENAAHDVTINPAWSTGYSNSGYTPMVFRIDLTTPTSTRYLWHCQGFYAATVSGYYQQLYITSPAASTQQALLYDTTNPLTHNPSTLQGASLISLNQVQVGPNLHHTRVFLYADNNFIWFWEMQNISGTNPAPSNANYAPTNLTQYLYLKKMTYGGTETTINSIIPKGLDGTHWPTQSLNDTVSSVSIIIPTFEYIGTPRVIFRKLVIDKASSSETLSNLTIPNDNGNVSTRIYQTQGYANTYAQLAVFTKGGGVINNDMYRAFKQMMSWVTTMPSGNIYLNLGVAQTTTDTDTTINNNYRNGNRCYGYPHIDANQQFKIWSWQLDAGLTTATYMSESDFSTIGPKYYFPLNDNWNTLYVGGIIEYPQDTIWVFNEQYYQWQKVQTLPYNATQVAVDGQSRLWTIVTPGNNWSTSKEEINLETITLPYTANVVFANTSLIFTGANISTTANVDVFDAYGTRRSANVTLNIVGSGMTFIDGTTSNTYATSSTVTTPYAFTVTSGSYTRVVATINQVLS